MGRTEILLPLGAGLIAAAGFALDLRFGNDAFARSGSLIVAFGAALAGREIYNGERAIARNEARVEKIEAVYLDAANTGATEDTASPEAFQRLAKTLGEYREARLGRVGRMIYLEIGIVCLGTLIWGFGDLVV